MYVDRFGWIPLPLDAQESFGELRTVPDFDEAVTWMKKRFDYEGYAYPPCDDVATWREPHEASNVTHRVVRQIKRNTVLAMTNMWMSLQALLRWDHSFCRILCDVTRTEQGRGTFSVIWLEASRISFQKK